MNTQHPTHLLFLPTKSEGLREPTEKPIEDDLTFMVDEIFSKLKKSEHAYRGSHDTGYGVYSDNYDYLHDYFCLVSNSLAPYYIRHHRENITDFQIKWIKNIHFILTTNITFFSKGDEVVFYWLDEPMRYGRFYTQKIKFINGNEDNINQYPQKIGAKHFPLIEVILEENKKDYEGMFSFIFDFNTNVLTAI